MNSYGKFLTNTLSGFFTTFEVDLGNTPLHIIAFFLLSYPIMVTCPLHQEFFRRFLHTVSVTTLNGTNIQ